MAMTLILVGGLVLLLVLAADIVVTVAIIRNTAGSMQKLFQVIFVWLVPIVGAAVSWYVLREERHTGMKRGEGNEYLWWNTPDSNEGHSGHDGETDGGH
jgi:hypothetical protein